MGEEVAAQTITESSPVPVHITPVNALTQSQSKKLQLMMTPLSYFDHNVKGIGNESMPGKLDANKTPKLHAVTMTDRTQIALKQFGLNQNSPIITRSQYQDLLLSSGRRQPISPFLQLAP